MTGVLRQLARLPLRAIPREAEVRVLRGPNRGMRWVARSSNAGCWLGTFEREETEMLMRTIRPGDTVLDAGANVGYYTLVASRLVGPTGKVIAFEPLYRNAQYLERHIRLNQLTNVRVERVALSRQSGFGTLFVGRPDSASLFPLDSGLVPHQVPTVALDDWRRAGELPGPVNVIKMDIEGAEGAALLGMQGILASDKPYLYIALHGGPLEGEARAMLAGLGYTITMPDPAILVAS